MTNKFGWVFLFLFFCLSVLRQNRHQKPKGQEEKRTEFHRLKQKCSILDNLHLLQIYWERSRSRSSFDLMQILNVSE